MTRLNDYQSALLVADPEVSDMELQQLLEAGGPEFVSFVVDHGLGPMWHERTRSDALRASRLAAEALYSAQERAIEEIDVVLSQAGIEYVLIKGGASRLFLYENPAVRACFDLDLLVRRADRVQAVSVLIEAGFSATAKVDNISRELVLTRGPVDIDLHWGLLREGRLRVDPTMEMLNRRQRVGSVWMLDPNDGLFVHLVHPAFAKHLAGWGMGLHRVVDILCWLLTQPIDWDAIVARLEQQGVRTAAWATLRWVAMLVPSGTIPELEARLLSLQPGKLRRAWLERWLRHDVSERISGTHLVRLLAFSMFLHDTPGDGMRALLGRLRAHRRRSEDLDAFAELLEQ